jgi:hypothetical protein
MSVDNDVESKGARLGSIMAAAGKAKRDDEAAETTIIHTVLLPKISTDPLDELVDRVRPELGNAVDALQVAAVLESDGISDRNARVEYGYSDVFALAGEVYRRLGPALPATPGIASGRARRDWRDGLRQVSHGPLYVLPSAVFPAVMAVVGRRSLVLALVFASGLGWVYAGVTAHAAYRLLGLGRPGAAARLLRIATLGAPVAGVALGAVVVWLAGGGLPLVAMVVGQLAYQLASTVLVFYREEGRQAMAMVPAFLAGLAFLIWGGTGLRTLSVGVAVVSVAAAFAVAIWATRGRDADGEQSSGDLLRAETPMLAGVGAYALCSAVLLLHAEAPYLQGRLDVAIAVAPLILAMGFVEWRADRFRERAIDLTRRALLPRAFVRGVWMLLFREMAACLLLPATLAALMLFGLWQTGLLSAAGAVMTAAHVALAAAYYLAFLLAGLSRFGWLCASLLAAIAVHIGIGAVLGVAPLLGQTAAPLADTTLYLGSVLLLQPLFLLGLAPLIGQVRRYR